MTAFIINFNPQIYICTNNLYYINNLDSNDRKKKLPFDGYIIVEDWNENFIEGYKYEDGKVIGSIVDPNKTSGGKSIKLEMVCTTTDWYQYTSDGNVTYLDSQTTCSYVDNGGGYSNNGGGSPPGDYYFPQENNSYQMKDLYLKFCTDDKTYHNFLKKQIMQMLKAQVLLVILAITQI